jgi:hypothetical protein
MPTSKKQRAANRRTSLASTDPRLPTGKRMPSRIPAIRSRQTVVTGTETRLAALTTHDNEANSRLLDRLSLPSAADTDTIPRYLKTLCNAHYRAISVLHCLQSRRLASPSEA